MRRMNRMKKEIENNSTEKRRKNRYKRKKYERQRKNFEETTKKEKEKEKEIKKQKNGSKKLSKWKIQQWRKKNCFCSKGETNKRTECKREKSFVGRKRK